MAIDLFEPVSVTYDRKSFVDRGFWFGVILKLE
jgi:hypothetical protein